jgi:hypothetical protein
MEVIPFFTQEANPCKGLAVIQIVRMMTVRDYNKGFELAQARHLATLFARPSPQI